MEHPGLLGVTHREHLPRPTVRPVETVLLRQAAHELDRLARAWSGLGLGLGLGLVALSLIMTQRAAAPLGRDLGQLVDTQQRAAVGRSFGADHVGSKDRRRRGLAWLGLGWGLGLGIGKRIA